MDMKKARKVISWALGLLSAFVAYKGATMFVATSGAVQGSEFGMLITIVNQISLLMMWFALFAAWNITKPIDIAKATSTMHSN